jgi:hypothetical protein
MLQVKPAYGRIYQSAEEVITDWEANKDFKISGGPYINKSDWKKYNKEFDSVIFTGPPIKLFLEYGFLD